jgi:hypothetical protein
VAQNYSLNYVEGILTITKADQIITFEPFDESLKKSESPIELVAVASSGLVITYLLDSGPGEISGNIFTVTEPGIVMITASQTGNENYNEATPVSRTVEVVDDLVLGVEDSFDRVAVYPNPVREKLIIKFSEGILAIKLFNTNHQDVGSFVSVSQSELQVDVSDLADGMYFLLIETFGGKTFLRRLAISKQ